MGGLCKLVGFLIGFKGWIFGGGVEGVNFFVWFKEVVFGCLGIVYVFLFFIREEVCVEDFFVVVVFDFIWFEVLIFGMVDRINVLFIGWIWDKEGFLKIVGVCFVIFIKDCWYELVWNF